MAWRCSLKESLILGGQGAREGALVVRSSHRRRSGSELGSDVEALGSVRA